MKTVKFIFIAMVLANLFAGCGDYDEPLTAYDSADALKGGIMYDKFWSTEAGYDQSSVHLAKLNAFSEFFRCKQCHAWDGLGNAGSFINMQPKTTRPNISGLNLYKLSKTSTEEELFSAMRKTSGRRDISYDLRSYNPTTNATEGDKMPNFTQLLTTAQIWDIVKFMREGMVNVDMLYTGTYTGVYPTGTVAFSNLGRDGIETNGNVFYSANCVHCHGVNGKTLSIEGMSLGEFVRSRPNEVQHKVKYGKPGAIMDGEFDISIGQMKNLYKAFSNSVTYPD